MAEEVLAQLKDIHLPDPISWWPLAPACYVLLFFILLLMFALFYFGRKRYLGARVKNQALSLLAVYKKQYEQDQDVQWISAHISELLKRVALLYYSREEVASLHGLAWLEFLNRTSKGLDFKPVQSLLIEAPYRIADAMNPQPLITLAQRWIKQRGLHV